MTRTRVGFHSLERETGPNPFNNREKWALFLNTKAWPGDLLHWRNRFFAINNTFAGRSASRRIR
jgi:hypothetical protein